MPEWLYFVLFGSVVGWIANLIMGGRGLGLIGNVVVGVLGVLIGDWLFRTFNFSISITDSALINNLVQAVAGAVLLLFVIGLVRRR